jgi:hypothetical protein
MAVLHNNANRYFMHLIWKIYHYELVTGIEKDIHVSHKGQGAATNREKGQGVTFEVLFIQDSVWLMVQQFAAY